MSRYTGYNSDWGKTSKLKYVKEQQHRVEVSWKNTDYTERIEPAIRESGLPAATFIKKAVEEKIERMRKDPTTPR